MQKDHLVMWGRVVVEVACGKEQIDKYTIYGLVSLVEMQDYNVNVTVALTPHAV